MNAQDKQDAARERLARDMEFIRIEGDFIHILPGIVGGKILVGKEHAQQLLDELEHYYLSGETSFLPAILQISNVAALPGIMGSSIGLPDIHTGYGFAIGHVAAFDFDDPLSVVSPGGIGFDINCGVRMLRSNLLLEQLRPLQQSLTDEIFHQVPVGVGGRNNLSLTVKDIREILETGMNWAVKNEFAWPEDLELCESNGCIKISGLKEALNQRAEARGLPQLGTLGSGNHYIEVQHVTDIYDMEAAKAMGIERIGQICVMIHCGSRGLGHQYADDAIKAMDKVMKRDKIHVNDPMLACARISSPEGQTYLSQMAAASNFAFVNRSIIAHKVRESFKKVFGKSPKELKLAMVYDVAHNIAKIEDHIVEDKAKKLLVLRKGSTRSLPPHHPDLPNAYREIGQPVFVGGSMGTCSYVLKGAETSMNLTFGSTCHGAGRAQSRHKMRKTLTSHEVVTSLTDQGITLRVASLSSISEEAPMSYKDVEKVVDICHKAGISTKVLRLEPVCVVKG